jgi:hypothetical protein
VGTSRIGDAETGENDPDFLNRRLHPTPSHGYRSQSEVKVVP